MIKVLLTTMAGRKTDLFPESFTFKEVFREFQVDCVCKAILVDGELIPEEKLRSSLREYSQDSIMHITVSTITEKTEEPDLHVEVMTLDEDVFRSIYDEMIEMRDKLNDLLNKMENRYPEWTVPF